MKQICVIGAVLFSALLCGCAPSKVDIEAKSKTLTQQIIDENQTLKGLGLVVDRVDAIREDGNKYKGIAQITMDGEHHQVAVSILADGDKILVSTEPGAFVFTMGKIVKKVTNTLAAKEVIGSTPTELEGVIQTGSFEDCCNNGLSQQKPYRFLELLDPISVPSGDGASTQAVKKVQIDYQWPEYTSAHDGSTVKVLCREVFPGRTGHYALDLFCKT